MSYTNSPPKYKTTLIFKTTLLFCHSWQMVSHWEAVISSSSSSPEPSSSSLSSKAYGDGEGDGNAMKPSIRACCHAIQLTRVFTWYNSVASVSRRASMCSSCAITASSVTPPLKEEEEGAKGARGVAVLVRGCFGWSWASLYRTITTLMAHITVKWGDSG